MILDADGDELTYWPIFGLEEGQTLGPVIIKIVTPVAHGFLRADSDSRLTVEARVHGVGSYIDIAASPMSLQAISAGTTSFDLKVTANSPIVGVERVPIYVSTAVAGPAGWAS